MIKELILAIILGCLLGFGVTGGYIAVKKNQAADKTIASISPVPTINESISPAPTTVEQNSNSEHKITIDTPANESVISTSQFTLKGTTSPSSSLVITTTSKSFLTNADTSGNFSLDIEAESGPNMIQIYSFDEKDNQASTQLLVTYSTAKF